MNFPDDWPEACPPNDSNEADGVVFAAARSTPFARLDFSSANDRGAFKDADECERRGVSVMKEKSDVEALLERFKRKFKHIAKAELSSTHGRLKDTPREFAKSHCTLWPRETVNLKDLFEVIV